MTDTTRRSLATALGTALVTSRLYVEQAKTDLRSEYQRRFNEKRWQVYTSFADTIRDLLVATKKNRLEKEFFSFQDRFFKFIGELWLVGSDDVVKAVLKWRAMSQSDEKAQSAEALVSLVDTLIAMRRDLGETETEVTARDILSTFINDIDKVLPKP